MAGSFVFDAEVRTNTGKGDARRLRNLGKVPAVLYGGGEPVSLILEHNKVVKALENEATYSHILTLNIGDKQEQAILKELQRHPSKPIIMHMDFQRVSESDKIKVHVPLHFVNQETSVGVKKGGVVNHNLVDVEVTCLPSQLPEFIEVDMADVDIGESVHLSDLKLPVGVQIVALLHGPEHDTPVAVIQTTRAAEAG
ncbi:50S ribosomal protein L25/general stress protein Ctc [Methylomagnum ishizawai]|uniref:50S ribosomal protein L25/general stress protein Ctc n=1 Tax=Methylomagnum ishizawai TaxID=1760988 RepID=UPI001C32C8C3|nr:50S ribosomal protein L25/general stress protein Ctc [Methylomagnum ishizawai]BBL76586.1 50S ribosomal protein L25 [Methylomagnum ishizawai]